MALSKKVKIGIGVGVFALVSAAAYFIMKPRKITATYGIGDKQIDVTDFIKSLASGQMISVSNETFGNDPAPGYGKKLTISDGTNSIVIDEGGSYTA